MADPISINEARRAVGIDGEDSSEDSRLRPILAGVIRQFREEAGWSVAGTESVTGVVSGTGSDLLALPIGPVNSVSTVELRFASGVSAGWTSFIDDPANDLLIDGRLIYTVSGLAFPRGSGNMRVTWSTGYASPSSVPASVREAILERMAEAYRGRTVASSSVQRSESGTRPLASSLWHSVISTYRPVAGF